MHFLNLQCKGGHRTKLLSPRLEGQTHELKEPELTHMWKPLGNLCPDWKNEAIISKWLQAKMWTRLKVKSLQGDPIQRDTHNVVRFKSRISTRFPQYILQKYPLDTSAEKREKTSQRPLYSTRPTLKGNWLARA